MSNDRKLIHRLYIVARCEVCGKTPMASEFPYIIDGDAEEKAEEGQAVIDLINKGYTIKTVAKPPRIESCQCDDPLIELDRCINH